jgi:hypothetical protein
MFIIASLWLTLYRRSIWAAERESEAFASEGKVSILRVTSSSPIRKPYFPVVGSKVSASRSGLASQESHLAIGNNLVLLIKVEIR